MGKATQEAADKGTCLAPWIFPVIWDGRASEFTTPPQMCLKGREAKGRFLERLQQW